MTLYATHRFSVGQQVACPGRDTTQYLVTGQIKGPGGPRYRIRSSDGSRGVVAERELAYAPAHPPADGSQGGPGIGGTGARAKKRSSNYFPGAGAASSGRG